MNEHETLSDNANEPMLTPLEARVLGSLMEKQQTTPDTYPLTLNSLVLACNQKTSREPVMNVNNGEVQRCLNQLQERGLVDIDYGSRADKYQQKISRVLHLDKAEQAIFSLLLLRGPQTLNELLSRSARQYEFSSSNELNDLIERQLNKLQPILMKIPAQAGLREDRYMHLLCGEPDISALARPSRSTNTSTPVNEELLARVTLLEQQVADLTKRLVQLES